MAETEIERLHGREAELETENADLRAAGAAGDARDRRHRAIFESAVDLAIIATDRKGRVTDWNTGAERILGWSAEEMAGEPIDRFFTPEDRAGNRPGIEMQRALKAGRASNERWHLRKDGSRFWAVGEMTPLRGEGGAPLGFLNILRDRTAQRRALEAQRTDAEFLRSILASSDDCIKVLDLDAKLTFMSEGGQHVMEVSDFNAILGCPWPDFWQGEGHAEAKAAVEAAKAGGKGRFQGFADTMAGSPRWWDVQVTPILGADGRPEKLLSVSRDITALKQAEENLRELNETLERRVEERTAELMRAEAQLRQSQKMEAVGQLTGGLAHDFNNLLTGIIGGLELLQTRIAQGRLGEVDRYVTIAQSAAKRAAALTHRLLAFSRRQTLDPKPTNINRLITGMEDMIRRTVGPAIAIEVVGAAGLWTAVVDPNQLENALLNLCINARDAMPEGGRLTIETANKWLDERMGRECDLMPGQYLSLCVTDTGTGMTPEVIKRAFDPFFTTKPLGEGTGLGLSMIYGFARQSGGQVRIYSEVGQGTTMCLYLPRHHGQENGAEASAEHGPARSAEQDETVLVVDDEPIVRMLVTEALEELGYRAIDAADGAAGLKVLQSDIRIDLLVTDVGLPGGMNGRQLADAARVARPGLKVLFITGYAENAVIGNGHLDPGMHVVTKPFGMEALASRIRDLIAQE